MPAYKIISIQQNHLITLVAAAGICNLMELEKLVPKNTRIAGQIRRIHESITNIAGLAGGKLDEDWINIGVSASNASMKIISKAIKATEPKKTKKTTPCVARGAA